MARLGHGRAGMVGQIKQAPNRLIQLAKDVLRVALQISHMHAFVCVSVSVYVCVCEVPDFGQMLLFSSSFLHELSVVFVCSVVAGFGCIMSFR